MPDASPRWTTKYGPSSSGGGTALGLVQVMPVLCGGCLTCTWGYFLVVLLLECAVVFCR